MRMHGAYGHTLILVYRCFTILNVYIFPFQVAKLEEELSAKTRAFHILEERLRIQDDYEEIKRELRSEITTWFAVYIYTLIQQRSH